MTYKFSRWALAHLAGKNSQALERNPWAEFNETR